MLEDLLLFLGLLGLVVSIGIRVSLRKDGTKNTNGKDGDSIERPHER